VAPTDTATSVSDVTVSSQSTSFGRVLVLASARHGHRLLEWGPVEPDTLEA